jgi:hypothetical protein
MGVIGITTQRLFISGERICIVFQIVEGIAASIVGKGIVWIKTQRLVIG